MPPQRALLVFAKAPQLGRVKTRLAADLGEETALKIYRALAEHIWTQLVEIRDTLYFKLWLCFDPPEAEKNMLTWLPGADHYLPQTRGDLGARISRAFETAFIRGFEQVAIVGMDMPRLDGSHLQDAFHRAHKGRVIVGPTYDGGFYLMALSAPWAALEFIFEDVPWSSHKALFTIHQKASAFGLDWMELPIEEDIDTADDWQRFQKTPLGQRFAKLLLAL